jgi:hypothetical protein
MLFGGATAVICVVDYIGFLGKDCLYINFFGGMGFKHLTSFNVAMLGKQGWRFQTDSSSLVCRLFKARYFPNSDCIGSKIGHNSSYVW